MGAPERAFGFSPPATPYERHPGRPVDRINLHEVHVAIEPAMLESVSEEEDVAEIPALGKKAGLISIAANHYRNIAEPALHQQGFVAGFFPIRARKENAPASPAVTA